MIDEMVDKMVDMIIMINMITWIGFEPSIFEQLASSYLKQ